MGERLLRKIYTKEALEKMSADEFQEAKKAEKQRLKILHTQQVFLSDTQKARVILLSYTQARFVPRSCTSRLSSCSSNEEEVNRLFAAILHWPAPLSENPLPPPSFISLVMGRRPQALHKRWSDWGLYG